MIFLLACVGADSGTVVGNPGDSFTTVADPKGLTWGSAELTLDRVVMTPCGARDHDVVTVDAPIDLLAPDPLQIPAGDWCGLTLYADRLELQASASGGERVFVDLDELAVVVSGSVPVDGGAYVLELAEPGWLDADALALDPRDPLEIDGAHADADALVAALEYGSGLYADDGDGVLSEQERDAGALASGPERAWEGGSDTGSVAVGGCGVPAPAGLLGLVAGIVLGWTRRRARPVRCG